MYTAVVLTLESQARLLEAFKKDVPDGWEVIAHHMTCNMGSAHETVQPFLGQTVDVIVKSLAVNPLVLAAGVECVIPSTNLRKHVTLAVNRANGGKPVMSNKLEEWVPVEELVLQGEVLEVS
jgi:hypothetical protein